MAGRLKNKLQNRFRCTGTTSSNGSDCARTGSGESPSKGIDFQGRNDYFLENGRLLLEERVSLFHGKTNPIRCLSVNDINSSFEDWILFDKFDGPNWYKCVWEGRPVLAKLVQADTYNDYNYSWREGICREIAVATQMCINNNILKLLACCLETKCPVLVYEFAANGRLDDRIDREKNENKAPLKWKDRLRIAREISHAVAYLHSAFPRPIIHRNLKPGNVFLDQDNVAKLTDFNFSISIPKGETHVEDDVIGTYGYLAPEYGLTWKVTLKADVYSFGASFLELLIGMNLLTWLKKEDFGQGYLDAEVRQALKDKQINEIVDPIIITENEAAAANEDLVHRQLQASIKLVLRCIARDAESRPTMEEVATELKNIMMFAESSICTTSTGSIAE